MWGWLSHRARRQIIKYIRGNTGATWISKPNLTSAYKLNWEQCLDSCPSLYKGGIWLIPNNDPTQPNRTIFRDRGTRSPATDCHTSQHRGVSVGSREGTEETLDPQRSWTTRCMEPATWRTVSVLRRTGAFLFDRSKPLFFMFLWQIWGTFSRHCSSEPAHPTTTGFKSINMSQTLVERFIWTATHSTIYLSSEK